MCEPRKHPKSLIRDHVPLSTAPESLRPGDAEISAGSPRVALKGTPASVKGTATSARAEPHLGLPAPRWLLGQWGFPGCGSGQASHGRTSLGWDHAIALSPQGGGALATPG